MKSPLRVFFFAALVCLGIALLLQAAGKNLGFKLLELAGSIPSLYTSELTLPRYYFETGQPDQAIIETNALIPSLSPINRVAAQQSLVKLINLRQSGLGQLGFIMLNLASFWPSKLFITAFLLGVLFFAFFLNRILSHPPLFVIIPFIDRAGLDIGDELPRAVLDRLREMDWRMKKIQSAQGMLAEQLDIPSLGLISEGDSIDTVALLETALLFSTGINDLPLSRLFNSLTLWAEQPQYLIRGSFEKINGKILLSLQIVDRKRRRVIQAWDHEIAGESHRRRSDIVDAILYPLLFYFTKGIEAKRWEALHALHIGLEEFQSFNEHQDQIAHLTSAQENIERAININPAYRLAHYDLGLVYLAGGAYEIAREHLLNASKLFQEDIIGKKATYNYGVALFLLAQDWAYERAVKTFQTLLESDNLSLELIGLTRSSLAVTYAKMAARSRDQRDDLSQQAFTEADFVLNLKTSVSNEAIANAWVAKGYAYLALEQNPQAKSAFSGALKFDTDNRTALIGLGAAEFALQHTEDALNALRQASILSPLGGYAHYRIGNLYREMKDSDRAIESYKKAANLAVARVALGKMYLEKGFLLDALEEFRRSVKINNRLSNGWSNLAWTILELDDQVLFEEAEDAARRALQLEKQESLFWHRRTILALCLARRGKLKAALKEALAGVDLGPKEAQAYFVLGSVQIQMGLSFEARENLTKVLNLDKKGHWRIEAQELIEKINAT